jgi:hypothetical protein
MQIRIEGADLPGPACGPSPEADLSWVTIGEAYAATLFRRAKLWLDGGVPQETLASAARQGQLVGRLRLTNAKGTPLCAAVRPPLIEWSAAS